MKIVLTAIDKPLRDAWKRHCLGAENVVICDCKSILDLTVDAVVSPANSFGFMDGGIDAVYLRRFGQAIQEDLRFHIVLNHDGELLVGKAQIIRTHDERIPWLISAPTMRVPSDIRGTVNAYLAARAALRVACEYHVDAVAFPGLGTGVGQLPPDICARQVRAAIDDVFNPRPFPARLADAHLRHMAMTRENSGFTVE